ncbi:MAG: hypothetical protein KIT09_06660 [Bryobacteraceae bacterium]|nr:hypothetical protein [Bryobacteraceae bacterium]
MARHPEVDKYIRQIASMGGKARAEKLTPEQQSEIGRKAGLVGGKARAKKLSAERRSEIARKAVQARWSKVSDSQ